MEKEKEPALNFKPLSEGLGFHPFSNGLPYAPQTQSRPTTSTGAGAIAAGRPTFSFPQTPVAKSPPTAAATPTHAIVAKTATIMPELGWDYLAKRALAYFVDSFFNLALGIAALVACLWNEDMSPDSFLNENVLLITLSFLLFFNWALITAEEVAFKTSIGKKFFGLSLEGSAVATLVRAIFFIPSLLCLGLGVLWAVFDPNRRGFHDLVSGIQPEEN